MQKLTTRAAATALALAAVISILGGIDALSRTSVSHDVLALPTVEIIVVRTTEASAERVVR